MSFTPKLRWALLTGAAEADIYQGEILNLLARRQVPFRILGKGPWKAEETQNLVAILCSEAWCSRRHSARVAVEICRARRTADCSEHLGETNRRILSHDLEDDYVLVRCGSGRLAWSREAWQDPYRVAESIHLLMSRRNDLFRLGNGASMSVRCTGSSDGRMMLIQLVSFDRRAGRVPVSLWVKPKFRAARLWKLGSNEPMPLSSKTRARRPRVLVATIHYLCGSGAGKLIGLVRQESC